MQQLTKTTLQRAFTRLDAVIEVSLALPETPLKAQQLTQALATHFALTPGEADWGADRYQVALNSAGNNNELRCILCIEWLCEAIWLEPTGTTTIESLWQALKE
ncbi:hypothetical protein HHX48_12275 [Salinimonas sp. HHU 13199]|uniref:DUF3630 domain-containing protein n=1 Tax=Salinimonas profundi TaxID=2729140 RepID=A0ABR8LMJ8_9ALTE|nr:hypothetical protein [Salinimonas profundi]MBD3586515.1 hypothetical protein [Salinimonas profundi]